MKADLIVRDGVVFTGTDAPQSGGVAVRNGRIIGVGDVRGFDSLRTETIDANGGLITPGFIDAHVHPVTGGLKLAQCSLYDAATAQEGLELVGAYAKARHDAEWIWGGGWSMEWFPRGTPSAEALDRVTGDRPALLYNKDGHGAWVNTAALQRAHITAATEDPNDGRIERLDDGSPQGTLHEGAMDLVSELLPKFTRTDWEAALLAGQKYLLSCGITGWQDADVQPAQEEAYLALAERGEFKASVVGALWWERDHGMEQIESLLGRRARFAPGYRPTSVKLMLDGTVENYTAALLEPYRDFEGDETDNTGIDFIDGELLKEIVRILDRLGFQCHFHTLGSRAVRHALDALEALPAPRNRRHHLAHLQVVDRADIGRFAGVGAIANCQALWACREPQMTDLTLPFLGPISAENLYPFAALAKAGATLAMGSDWPVSTANVYEQIDVAVTRTHREYRERPPLNLVQGLTLTQALNGFTNGSAQVNRIEHEVGRIEGGMAADLAVADRNPFAGGSIADTKTTHTIIGGRVVFSDS
ncbi:MAG: amidohydrolase [Acidimicrobiia bacterium]